MHPQISNFFLIIPDQVPQRRVHKQLIGWCKFQNTFNAGLYYPFCEHSSKPWEVAGNKLVKLMAGHLGYGFALGIS
jgi:hypothetical protein